jgi:hypothetical protein
MSLSLTNITTDLEQLIAMREEVLAGEMCPTCLGTSETFHGCDNPHCFSGRIIDAAELEQIELAIKQYSTDLLPNKVDAYWFTLKKIGKKDDSKPLDKQTGLIADAKREVKRLQALIDRWDALQETLRGYALEAMRQRDTKSLDGTNGRKLRRQANGGVQGVDVRQPELVPDEFVRLTVQMTYAQWTRLLSCHVIMEGVTVKSRDPDLTSIGDALRKREMCPNCQRKHGGDVATGRMSDDPEDICSTCHGEATIPGSVPGCVLKDRGERLVVS